MAMLAVMGTMATSVSADLSVDEVVVDTTAAVEVVVDTTDTG